MIYPQEWRVEEQPAPQGIGGADPDDEDGPWIDTNCALSRSGTSYHQTNSGIHYTTARRDLLELHEKGYLVMEQRGKAFVFAPGPRLDELNATSAG
jgi:hypothetical protein